METAETCFSSVTVQTHPRTNLLKNGRRPGTGIPLNLVVSQWYIKRFPEGATVCVVNQASRVKCGTPFCGGRKVGIIIRTSVLSALALRYNFFFSPRILIQGLETILGVGIARLLVPDPRGPLCQSARHRFKKCREPDSVHKLVNNQPKLCSVK